MATDKLTFTFRLTWLPPVVRRALSRERDVLWLWWPALLVRGALAAVRDRLP